MTPFLSRCYASRGAEHVELIAAALCADRQDYELLVIEALSDKGYQFYWSGTVLPATSWVKQYPAEAAYAVALARSVNEGRQRVALGAMMRQPGSRDVAEDDKWLQIETLGPFTPLDAQFSVYPKKTVPNMLRETLFGQPDPTKAERDEFGDHTPPLATYAVLDAAKMPYLLTSFLEDSGLRYQSLFQGKAQEELAEHAPYLVELTEDNHFTCRLFTGPDGIGGLWEKELGIFLRCRAGFDALRKHLRKFIRLQDADGRWFYFRFWEQRYAHCFFSTACAETHWMMMVTQEHSLAVICPKGSSIIIAHAYRSVEHTNIIASKPTEEWVAGLAEEESNRAFQNKLIEKFIFSNSKYGHIEHEKAQEIVKILLEQAQGYGFESEYALSTYVSVALELSQFPAENECYRKLLESAKHPDTKAELMLKSIVYAKGDADD